MSDSTTKFVLYHYTPSLAAAGIFVVLFLATAFLHTFLGNLSSQPDPRLVLSQAESHLFLDTPFPEQTQQRQPDAPRLMTIANLPILDLERAFKPVYAGRLESVHSLSALWMLHKVKDCGMTDEAKEEVLIEEIDERQLRYLGKWHAAARD